VLRIDEVLTIKVLEFTLLKSKTMHKGWISLINIQFICSWCLAWYYYKLPLISDIQSINILSVLDISWKCRCDGGELLVGQCNILCRCTDVAIYAIVIVSVAKV